MFECVLVFVRCEMALIVVLEGENRGWMIPQGVAIFQMMEGRRMVSDDGPLRLLVAWLRKKTRTVCH